MEESRFQRFSPRQSDLIDEGRALFFAKFPEEMLALKPCFVVMCVWCAWGHMPPHSCCWMMTVSDQLFYLHGRTGRFQGWSLDGPAVGSGDGQVPFLAERPAHNQGSKETQMHSTLIWVFWFRIFKNLCPSETGQNHRSSGQNKQFQSTCSSERLLSYGQPRSCVLL